MSKDECQDIVLMKWPSSGISETKICRAYCNLMRIAKAVYKKKVPIRVVYNLDKALSWSLLKRYLFLKSQNHIGFFLKELSNIYKNFYWHPRIIIISFLSYSISYLLREKDLNI